MYQKNIMTDFESGILCALLFLYTKSEHRCKTYAKLYSVLLLCKMKWE